MCLQLVLLGAESHDLLLFAAAKHVQNLLVVERIELSANGNMA